MFAGGCVQISLVIEIPVESGSLAWPAGPRQVGLGFVSALVERRR